MSTPIIPPRRPRTTPRGDAAESPEITAPTPENDAGAAPGRVDADASFEAAGDNARRRAVLVVMVVLFVCELGLSNTSIGTPSDAGQMVLGHVVAGLRGAAPRFVKGGNAIADAVPLTLIVEHAYRLAWPFVAVFFDWPRLLLLGAWTEYREDPQVFVRGAVSAGIVLFFALVAAQKALPAWAKPVAVIEGVRAGLVATYRWIGVGITDVLNAPYVLGLGDIMVTMFDLGAAIGSTLAAPYELALALAAYLRENATRKDYAVNVTCALIAAVLSLGWLRVVVDEHTNVLFYVVGKGYIAVAVVVVQVYLRIRGSRGDRGWPFAIAVIGYFVLGVVIEAVCVMTVAYAFGTDIYMHMRRRGVGGTS